MDISELKRQDLSRVSRRHPWESTRARIIRFLIKTYVPRYDHVLDMGSGDAYVISQLFAERKGKIFSAVDTAYSPEYMQIVANLHPQGIKFFPSTDAFRASAPPADLVLLTDVLEHCENDAAVLSLCLDNNISNKEAFILVTVPAYQQLFSAHDRLLGHYRRYTRKQLIQLCSSSGLRIHQTGYFFFSLWAVRGIHKLMEKISLRNPAVTIENWAGNKIATSFISFILWMDFSAGFLLSKTGINIPGLSCYCLCQKPLL